MSKKRKVVAFKDYIKRAPSVEEGVKTVVGSDITPLSAVDVALDQSDIFVISCESREASFQKIEMNFEAFLQDPVPFLINTNCSERRFYNDSFRRNVKKSEFLTGVEEFLAASVFRKTRTDVLLVVDELFTNFSKVAVDDRDIEFFMDSDQDRVVVGCRDSLGALDPSMMLNNIQKCYKFGVRESISKDVSGGAGIGSFLMYNVSEGMALISELEKQSLVLFWISKDIRHDDRVDANKDIIIFKKGDKNGTDS